MDNNIIKWLNRGYNYLGHIDKGTTIVRDGNFNLKTRNIIRIDNNIGNKRQEFIINGLVINNRLNWLIIESNKFK